MPGNVRTDHITHRTGPAAGTPEAGSVVCYVKSDGNMYMKDENGTEVAFLTDVTPSGGDKSLTDNTANAWRVLEGSNEYLGFDTTDNLERAQLGDKGITTLQTIIEAGNRGLVLDSLGTVLMDAVGNVEINSSTGQILIGTDDVDQDISIGTAGERLITVGAAASRAAFNTATGGLTHDSTGQAIWNIADNLGLAWRLREGSNDYLLVDTTDGSEAMAFGNAVTNPDFSFLGTGLFQVDGDANFQSGATFEGGVLINTAGSYSQTIGGFTYNAASDDFDVMACSSFNVVAGGGAADAVRLQATGAGGFDFDVGTGGYNLNSTGQMQVRGPDNTTAFWGVFQAANPYIVCDSDNGAELITLAEDVFVAKDLDADGTLTTKRGVASGAIATVGGSIYENTDISSEIANTAAETDFDTKKTIEAGSLTLGATLKVSACVLVLEAVATPDLTLRLKLGATELLALVKSPAVTGDLAVIDFTIRILNGGGAATNRSILSYGSAQFGAADAAMEMKRTLNTGIDVSGALDLKLTGQWEEASTQNRVTCESLSITIE